MNTHISYKTSKALKEFCPELPEPMGDTWYRNDGVLCDSWIDRRDIRFPAYQLHDLLSRPFCEALSKKNPKHNFFEGDEPCDIPYDISIVLMERYHDSGLPSVEACLMEMIGGK